MPDASKPSKLLFVTTADTEILAVARASERLPESFPEIRCANPATLEDQASFFDEEVPAARVVLVRLLGGRRG
jgi:cobaltochelatase CobN